MSVGTDLRTLLLADTDITDIVGAMVYHSRVPQRGNVPYLWLQRRGVITDDANTATRGQAPRAYIYDIDAVSDDISEAEDLIDAVWAHLHFYNDTFGSGSAQIVVSDQSEQYISVNQDDDSGIFVQSLMVTITPN